LTADKCGPSPSTPPSVERGALELVELLRLRILRIFRPAHPDLADLDALELVLRRQETRIVIPVLMRQDDHIQSCREGANILDDRLDLFAPTGDRAVDSAIDQHPEIASVVLWKLEQVTVADSLAEETDRDFRSTGGDGACCHGLRLTCVAGQRHRRSCS